MNKRFLQVISALLCVLLLAGCGAKNTETGGQGKTKTDNPAEPRQILTDAQVTASIRWTDGQSGDPEILSAAQAYLLLVAKAQAMPENPVQSDPSCTDALVREAYLRGFLGSDYIYPKIKVEGALRDLTQLTADSVQVWVDGTYNLRYSSIDDGQKQWDHTAYGNPRLLTLTRTDSGWIVTGDDTDEMEICGYTSGYATENLPEGDVLQAIEKYFQMRADLIAGRDADGSCTTDTLLTESKVFAQCDRSGPVTGSRSVPYRFGVETRAGDQVTLQVMEALRVDGASCYMISRISHTLTLSRMNDQYIVTETSIFSTATPDRESTMSPF